MMCQNASLSERLHPKLRYHAARVVWAARYEMARTVEDVLARRTRALFLNAKAASEMAPKVAELMSHELGLDEIWLTGQVKNFQELALGYMVE
jgi:glycerol-3-phosphate dehydrogenase